MKKILVIIGFLTIAFSFALNALLPLANIVPQAQAQFVLYPTTTGRTDVRCQRDYVTFLSALISYDDFVEYWKDIFYRYNANICQYNDIDSLLKRINKVREQIRKAFYVCSNNTHLKEVYYELEAELFYLRKYVDPGNGTFKVTPETNVYNDLRGYFVLNKGWVTEAKAQQLFEKFKAKYTPKLETYKNCKDMSIQALVNKWNEFRENMGGIGPAIRSASDSVSKKWKRMMNTSMGLDRDFFGGFVDARVNGLPAKEGLKQIAEGFRKNFPNNQLTFDELQSTMDVKDVGYNYALQQEQYLASYQQQYYETSDQYARNVADKLILLKKIIEDSFKFQNQTIQCVGRLNKKQC